jgi:hypothetical protein
LDETNYSLIQDNICKQSSTGPESRKRNEDIGEPMGRRDKRKIAKEN